jgi:hypothetical protein
MSTTRVRRVRIRPLYADEEHLVDEVFDGLSPASRYLRFHTPLSRLPPSFRRVLATVLTGERQAVVAISGGRAVGLAHWIRDQEVRTRAELSMSVADTHQREGVGTRMASALAWSAQAAGIVDFSCWVSPHNTAVVSMLRQAGQGARLHEPGELVVPVRAISGRSLPATPGQASFSCTSSSSTPSGIEPELRTAEWKRRTSNASP